MKIKSLFLSIMLFQTIAQAGVLEQALCKQFYLNDKTVTVFDLLKQRASDNLTFPVESYYPYLSKLFPEFSEVDLVMLMAQMKSDEMTYTQISTRGTVSPRAQYYSNYTPTQLVVSRRILKTAGSSEITLSNVQALADFLKSQSDMPETELYRMVREKLVDGLQRGYATARILSELR